MNSSVIIFPGSNCDRDMDVALKKFGFKNKMVWHTDNELPKSDLVVMPGGFSYGDYLRCGSIAKFSPIIIEPKRFVDAPRTLKVANSKSLSARFITNVLNRTAAATRIPRNMKTSRNCDCCSRSFSVPERRFCFSTTPCETSARLPSTEPPASNLIYTDVASIPISFSKKVRWN